MTEDIETYLKTKGLEVYRTSGKELTLQCFFCGESHRKGKLYINSESGGFDCKICGQSGGYRTLLEHFGDEVKESAPAFKPSRRLEINELYLTAAVAALAGNTPMLDYLRHRGLSDDTIAKARFGYHPRGVSLIDGLDGVGVPGGYTRAEVRETGLLNEKGWEFLSGKIVIPYLSSQQVVQLRGKDPLGKYVTTPGENVRLYNADALRGAEFVLITEGEMDCLICQQCLSASPDVRARKIRVVGLAGAEAWPDGQKGFARYFENAKRVYIGLDNDDTGKRAALKLRDVLGAKARVVEVPDVKDWSDWLAPGQNHGWADIMAQLAEADMRDKRVYSVGESAWKLRELESSKPGIKLGWPTLDALLKPGLRPGSVTVPLARTGVGKSVILACIAYYNRNLPCLFITLELTVAETWNRLRRIARFFHPAMSDTELENLFPLLRLVDENMVSSSEFGALMDEFAEETGEVAQLVFVDYLGYYARAQRGKDQYERVTNAIMDLKRLAKEHEVAIIVPSQVNRSAKPGEPISEDDARDAGAVEETADFLFGIYRPWEANAIADASLAGAVHSELKVKILKSRHGNKGRVASLSMSHASLAIVDPSDRRNTNRVDMENSAFNRGDSYESIYNRDRQTALVRLQDELPFTTEELTR
jgi:hypothetical protein